MPNLSDKINDSISRQHVDLMRFAEGIRETVLRDMERLESQLTVALQNTAGKTDFTIGRMKALLQQTRETIATAYDGIANDTGTALESVARIAATETIAGLNTTIGARVLSMAMSADQIRAIAGNTLISGAPSASWWGQQSKTLQDKFAREMRDGQYRGETVDQLVRRVRGTRAGGFKDGIMRATRAQAEALVRTSVLAVSNEARRATYDDNRDVIKGVQHMSTLDGRTTLLCISLDGLQWDYPADGGLNYADFVPVGHDKEYLPAPCHWNCRSVDIPITYSWEELAAKHGNSLQNKIAKDVPESTRASMDGQVAATTTYGEWLAKQPAAFVDEVLGAGRAELWRAGKLSVEDLTDPSNRVLSLAELEGKYGIAPEVRAAEAAAREEERIAATIEQFEKDGRFTWGTGKDMALETYNQLFAMEPSRFADTIFKGLGLDDTSRIQMKSFVADRVTVSIQGAINGAEVQISRAFDATEKSVEHVIFTLPKAAQGTNIGKQVLRNFLELYDRAGIDLIEVHANIDIGGYAWAKYGFVPNETDWSFIRGIAQRKFDVIEDKFPTEVQYEVNAILKSREPGSIRDLANLKMPFEASISSATKSKTLGQYLLLGSDWEGTLDLSDPIERGILEDYIGKK